jgi:hypothetical protein
MQICFADVPNIGKESESFVLETSDRVSGEQSQGSVLSYLGTGVSFDSRLHFVRDVVMGHRIPDLMPQRATKASQLISRGDPCVKRVFQLLQLLSVSQLPSSGP